MKTFLPWVLVVALLGGVYFLYSANKDKDAQIAKLTQDSQELAQVKADNEELKKLVPQKQDADLLRKDHDDLLRLRGETQRLRDQVKQLTSQLTTAQSQATAVQAQMEKAREAQQQAAQQAAQLGASASNVSAQVSQELKLAQEQYASCLNNLRQIDGAKQQWALENKKGPDAVPTPEDIAPYLQNPSAIQCPAGGIYNINAVGSPPTCTVPSHLLPK